MGDVDMSVEDTPANTQVTLEPVSPTVLTGVAGDALSSDCVVKATRRGMPAPGLTLNFTVSKGGGTVQPSSVKTGVDGTAAARWTLGFGGKGQLLLVQGTDTNVVQFSADASARPLSFAPPQGSPFPAGNAPFSVRVGKMDSDNLPDLVVTLRGPGGKVAVLHNVGGGAFGAADAYDVESTPEGLAVGRINGDGIDDVAVANRNANTVTVYLGSTDGRLVSRNNYAVSGEPADLVMADFDGNGSRDLVVSSYTGDKITLLLGKGDGTFQASVQTTTVGIGPLGLAIGDLNGDAGEQVGGEFSKPDFLDIVVAQSQQKAMGVNDHTIGVLLGGAGLVFGNASHFRVQQSPQDVKLGDMDDIKGVDAVVSNTNSNSISILSGSGTGQFGPPTNYALGATPSYLAIADLDGDALQDIVVTTPLQDQVQVLLGSGRLPTRALNVGRRPQGLAIADVNGDGLPDLIVANSTSNSITVLLRK